jgi:hypothetical protein
MQQMATMALAYDVLSFIDQKSNATDRFCSLPEALPKESRIFFKSSTRSRSSAACSRLFSGDFFFADGILLLARRPRQMV